MPRRRDKAGVLPIAYRVQRQAKSGQQNHKRAGPLVFAWTTGQEFAGRDRDQAGAVAVRAQRNIAVIFFFAVHALP